MTLEEDSAELLNKLLAVLLLPVVLDNKFVSVHVVGHVLEEVVLLQDFERSHVEILPTAQVDV